MAITKEQLIQAGIEDSVATTILTAVNKVFKDTLDNNYVSKESFNTVNTKKNDLQTALTTANAELEQLRPLTEQVETLNTTIAQLRTANTDLQTKYDNQATVLNNENAVKNVLSSMVNDMDDVLPKIDMSKIVFKDGKIESGLSEQIETLKTAKPHYFKAESNNNSFFGFSPNEGNNNATNGSDSDDVAFAKSLASSKVEQSTNLKQATDIYFKGGIN